MMPRFAAIPKCGQRMADHFIGKRFKSLLAVLPIAFTMASARNYKKCWFTGCSHFEQPQNSVSMIFGRILWEVDTRREYRGVLCRPDDATVSIV